MGPRQVLALGTAAFGALAALNSVLSPAVDHTPLEAMATSRFPWIAGDLSYTESGTGSPVLLLHHVGLSASSYEMRYLLDALAANHRVYALDLLGFGHSDRPAIEYNADLFIRMITAFLSEVTGPCSIVASGLTAAYVLAVAAATPELVRDLTLSSPPLYAVDPAEDASSRLLRRALGAVPANNATLRVLTSRASIRQDLRRRLFSNPDQVTEEMVDVQSALAHQHGAEHVQQAYLRGALNLDLRTILPTVHAPILLVFGAQSRPGPLRTAAAYVRLLPSAQVLIIDHATRLPHEEQAERFAAAASAWFRPG